jgi:uncharacterized membrane protein (UPF0127 family)
VAATGVGACFGGAMNDPTTFVVDCARTRAQRARGLAARDPLAPGEGLHIPRCRSVHTVGMRFALDLIWLRPDGTVARVDRDVPPRRVRTCLRARSVVEVNAGQADAYLRATGTGVAL